MTGLQIKRVYEVPEPTDGVRVLVDRLWPRGLSREAAALDAWLKDVAPSPGLRTWWNHDPARLAEFAERYRSELDQNPAVDELRSLAAAHPQVTLLYGAHDVHINHAVVLRGYLEESQK